MLFERSNRRKRDAAKKNTPLNYYGKISRQYTEILHLDVYCNERCNLYCRKDYLWTLTNDGFENNFLTILPAYHVICFITMRHLLRSDPPWQAEHESDCKERLLCMVDEQWGVKCRHRYTRTDIRHFEQKALSLTQINLRASNAVSALAQSTISLSC